MIDTKRKLNPLAYAMETYIIMIAGDATDGLIAAADDVEQRLFELLMRERFMSVTQARELALKIVQAIGEPV